MKQLLITLLAILTFTACSDDDDVDKNESKTTVSIKTDAFQYSGGRIGVLLSSGKYIKISDISLNAFSGSTVELPTDTISRLYVFSDGEVPIDPTTNRPLKNKFDTIFIIKKKTNNEFILKKTTKIIFVYGDDDSVYPK